MNYDIIIFDADETLFDFKKSEEVALQNTIIEFGIDYNESYHLENYKIINTAIWKELEDGLIDQKTLKVERFKRFLNFLSLDLSPQEFALSYMKHLGNASFLYEDSSSLMKSLHLNHQLLIITNGLTMVQENRIRKSAIAKYFKEIVISEEVCVSKPDPKIFEIALKNFSQIDKKRILMVGDSLNSDIKGGLNFGIDTCWYNPNKIKNSSKINPTFEISNLMDLQSLLK